MALDGVTSYLRLKDVTIICKRMRCSLSIGGSSSVQWPKVWRCWILRMCFRRLLCVRIEIDQLQGVNCWVIIHCLSVSCTKINHSRCALVIWSSLQLTSKQELLLNNSLLELIYFLNIIRVAWYMVACLCHFVISFFRLFAWRYGVAPRRNNAKRKDKITKKRQAK